VDIDTFLEQPGSGSSADDQDSTLLRGQASAALQRWLRDHLEVAGEIKETIRAHLHLQEVERRTQRAEEAKRSAEHQCDSLMTKQDPANHRVLGFALGAILVGLLTVLDAIPLNWAAQAFGLGADSTWLVTFLLVAASVGAMLGLEVKRERARSPLAGVLTVGYVALAGLRTEFLMTVNGESLLVALMQSAMLTGISAALVLCGSAIMGRTRSLRLSRARAAVRRSGHAVAGARAVQSLADERLQRHIGSLRGILLPWAINSAAPAGVDRAAWAAALELAVRQLFPAP
jgi:hypothetical protein